MFGFEEYYNGLIEEAKSPEEIRKILHYQFEEGRGVPGLVIDRLIELDPTKKKSYTKWVLNNWGKETRLILESIKNHKLKKLFDYFQSRQNNGLNLTDIPSVKEAMDMMPEVDTVLTKEGDGPENDFDIVYDSPEWKIAVPHTYEASKKLGRGCKWCTAGAYRDDDYYFTSYTSRGPLWINYDFRKPEIAPEDKKEYPYTRYQFCFETGDFRNSKDLMIPSFKSIEIPEEAVEFYSNKSERYGEIIENDELDDEARAEEYEEERDNHSKTIAVSNDDESYLAIMPEYNYNYIFNEDCDYYIYDSEDTTDSAYPVPVNKDDYLVKKYNEAYKSSSALIIKDIRGNNVLFYISESHYWEYNVIKEIIKELNGFTFFTQENTPFLKVFLHNKNALAFTELYGDENEAKYNFNFGLPIKGTHKSYDQTSIYITITYSNGKASLIKLDEDAERFETIIKNESSIYNEFCVEYDDNNEPFIRTRTFTYHLTDESINAFYFVKTLYLDYVMVQNRHEEVFNILDKRNRKLVLESNVDSITPVLDNSPLLRLTYLDKSFIYDLKSLNIVSKHYDEINGINLDGKYLLVGENTNHNASYDCDIFDLDMNIYSNLKNVYLLHRFGDFKYAITQGEDKMLNLCDIKGNVLAANLHSVNNADATSRSENFLLLTKDGNISLYGFAQGIVLTNIKNKKSLYGLSAFISQNGNVAIIFPNSTNVVLGNKLVCSGNEYCVIENDNKIYFVNAYYIKSDKNGIDAENISNIEYYRGNSFIVTLKNGTIIEYMPDSNTYEIMTDAGNGEQDAQRLFKPNLNEIKSKFNYYLNKINEVKF